jgi:hypothetical protein
MKPSTTITKKEKEEKGKKIKKKVRMKKRIVKERNNFLLF